MERKNGVNVINKEFETEIINIIAIISEVEKEKISRDVNLRDDLGIDSMMGLEIMYAIEKKFQVQLKEDDLRKITSVQAIYTLINETLKRQKIND